jgi:hypothetical protein
MPNWKKVIVSGSDAILNNITASGNVSGSTISTASFGTYIGDGSQLSGISTTPFPFTGDAQISGSLIVSQSYTAGDTDSTALRLLGSGSVNQSGIFEVEGSAGPLFSVQDGLDGVLMEVNNISGLPLFQVSSSNEVFVNRGNLTSGVTTATASFAHFTGSFQGDGSNLTNLNTTTPTLAQVVTAGASATGDISITGSLNVSGSIGLTDGRNNVLLGEEAGKNLTTGTNSVMVGYGAGADSTLDTEGNFVFVGYQAGSGSIAGYGASGGSVYVGSQAGAGSDNSPGIGFGNTAIGYQTGYKANIQYSTGIGYGVFSLVAGSGNEDVAIGYNAMNRVAGGSTQNVAIGNSSLKGYNESYVSNRNTAVGYFTGKQLVNSHDNVLLGWKAGEGLGTSAGPSNYGGNIFIGTLAGDNILTGYNNIHLGPGLSGNSADIGQVKIGSGSAILISGSITTGDIIFPSTASAEYFVGDGSQLTNLPTSSTFPFTGDAQITGSLSVSGSVNINDSLSNIIISTVGSASSDNTAVTGNHNIVMGMSAAEDLGASSDNIIIGNRAASGSVFSATKGKNIIIGTEAGSDADMVDSANVVYIGYQAGFESTGASSVFVGVSAGKYADGNENVAVGGGAMTSNAGQGGTPLYNVAMGNHAMSHLWDGNHNVAIGHSAMRNPQQYYNTSTGTVAIGSSAIRNNRKNNYTVGAGYQSLYNLRGNDTDSGNHVTAIGAFAGFSEQFGYNHTLLGYRAGYNLTASTGSIVIGFDAASGTSYMDHQLFIGSGSSAIISGSLTTGDIIFPSTASAEYFVGDGSQLTNLPAGTTPTLQQVVTQGSFTTIPITASILSATASNAYGATADSLTVKGGDGIHAGGTNGGNLNLQGGNSSGASGARKGGNVIISGGEGPTSSGSISITGDTSITGSFIIEKSGSTVFEVIGSEGTLFSIDDDLDGTIFTANDRSGLPVLEASASGEVYIGKAPQSLYTTAVISSTTAATTQSIYGLSTSSYGGAFFDYTVQSGSDARAGSIMSVWNGSNISFTETTTTDIGDTTDFNVIVHISQSQAQIASHATRAGYNIKTIIRSI